MGSDKRNDVEPSYMQTSGLISHIPVIHLGDAIIAACSSPSSPSGQLTTQRRDFFKSVRLSQPLSFL
jgi:hypothetical protein